MLTDRKAMEWAKFGHSFANWLNFSGGSTPDQMEADYGPKNRETGRQLSDSAVAALLRTDYKSNPEAPGPLYDEETGLECSANLRRMATAWLEAHLDISSWQFKSELEAALKDRQPVLVPGSPPTFYLKTARSGDPIEDGRAYASWLFFKFVTSPLFDRLGRCTRCERFYIIDRRQPDRKYCSSICGSRTTAAESKRESRKAEKQARLEACRRETRDVRGKDLHDWSAGVGT